MGWSKHGKKHDVNYKVMFTGYLAYIHIDALGRPMDSKLGTLAQILGQGFDWLPTELQMS